MKIIVTVDTEGDNLWDWHPGKEITTHNAEFLNPFQEICEEYGFLPVYLVNYEMAMSERFVSFAKNKAKDRKCEIGMHLHAWNSPPEYTLLNTKYSGNPYITEYPKEVIYEKHKYLKDLIVQKFDQVPVSYRSGRWATNNDLFDVLEELGFKVDCSVTPGISHKGKGRTISHANSYSKRLAEPFVLRENLIEIPMTIMNKRSIHGENVKRRIINFIRGESLWLRPALASYEQMKQIIDLSIENGATYLMFMLHSSELMAGCNPYIKNNEELIMLLQGLRRIFDYASRIGDGIMLKDYYPYVKGIL